MDAGRLLFILCLGVFRLGVDPNQQGFSTDFDQNVRFLCNFGHYNFGRSERHFGNFDHPKFAQQGFWARFNESAFWKGKFRASQV